MRAVVQRVSRAQVRVAGNATGTIDGGLVVLLSVGVDDDDRDAEQIAEKIANLRIFRDDDGLMNRSIAEVSGAILLI